MSTQIVCWNEQCIYYKKLQDATIHKFGFSRKGTQRYQCKNCKKTITETKGTIFYSKHYSEETIIECFKLLANNNSLVSIERSKQVQGYTILLWLKEAAKNKSQASGLLAQHNFTENEISRLWGYLLKQKPK